MSIYFSYIGTATMGQESGLVECCDYLGVCAAGDGSNEGYRAVETGDLTQVSLDFLWLQHDE